MPLRLPQWLRRRERHVPTPEELAARDEGRRMLDDLETLCALDRLGPRGLTSDTRPKGLD